MSARNVAEPTVPHWQEITGLSPDLEPYMSRDERETAVRKLVEEVTRIATAEFARKTPQGERTYLYDPIHLICNTLGISRVKLSNYTKELTGMSAYEVTDKIKAKSLPEVLRKVVSERVDSLRDLLKAHVEDAIEGIDVKGPNDREGLDAGRNTMKDLKRTCANIVLDSLKKDREGTSIVAWAANLGYANPARLRRAAVLAHGRTVEALEWDLIWAKVREVVDQLINELCDESEAEENSASEKIAPHNKPEAPADVQNSSTNTENRATDQAPARATA